MEGRHPILDLLVLYLFPMISLIYLGKKEKASTKGKHLRSEKYRGVSEMMAKKTEIATDDKLDFDSDNQSDVT